MTVMEILNPDENQTLEHRVELLRKFVVMHSSSVDPEELEMPYIDVPMRVIRQIEEEYGLTGITYNLQHKISFKEGGVERIIGAVRNGKEGGLKDDLLSCTAKLNIPALIEVPDDYPGDDDREEFCSYFSEIHMIDREALKIKGLNSRLNICMMPGREYGKQPYILRCVADEYAS